MAETKNLTTSQVDRQNILNNSLAVTEVQNHTTIDGIFFEDKLYVTKEMVAAFFDVEIRTIERYISANLEELTANGYEVLKGARMNAFINAYNTHFATDINVGHKIRALSVFDFRSFLNIAMLLSESENARILRQTILDIVIDLVNQKTGGSTKYINQRDKDFVGAFLQEENYRREFTDALRDCVDMDNFKYAIFTDMIYQSIFREKSREYRQVLKLKSKEKIRDTFYSEILDLVDNQNRCIQIKATQIKRISISSEPDYLIVIQITPDGEWTEIYNGKGSVVWNNAGTLQKNGQRPISIAKLKKLMDTVPESEKISHK